MFSNLDQQDLVKVKSFYFLSFSYTVVFLVTNTVLEIWKHDIFDDWESKTFYYRPEVFETLYYVSVWETKLFVLLFLVFVNLLRFHYKKLHVILAKSSNRVNRQLWLFHLRRLRQKDLQVKDFVDFLHEYFVVIVTLQLFWGFTTCLFNVAVAANVGIPQRVQTMWALYLLCDIVFLVAFCHDAEFQGEKTVHYLHRLFIDWNDDEVKEEIDLFSLQIQHRKIEFTAVGFCKLNYSLIYGMIGSLTSYAVVLVQFQSETSDVKDLCRRFIGNATFHNC